MEVQFKKISSEMHQVSVLRNDGTSEVNCLNSRSFLRHDVAHWAVESVLSLQNGFWGSVAQGVSLSGADIEGDEIAVAEILSGPVQTMIRTEASADQYYSVLNRVLPRKVTEVDALEIYQTARNIMGHWRATPYGGVMTLEWSE